MGWGAAAMLGWIGSGRETLAYLAHLPPSSALPNHSHLSTVRSPPNIHKYPLGMPAPPQPHCRSSPASPPRLQSRAGRPLNSALLFAQPSTETAESFDRPCQLLLRIAHGDQCANQVAGSNNTLNDRRRWSSWLYCSATHDRSALDSKGVGLAY